MNANPTLSAGVTDSTKANPGNATGPEIKIYSHSPILYWWPVWLMGFVLALWTYVEGGRMAYVPAGTVVEGNKLVAPEPSGPLAPPQDRMARNPYLGCWFLIVILIVFVATNVSLRGLWEWVSVLAIALAISLMWTWGLWDNLAEWFRLLHVHVNLAGYLFVSTWLFAVWAVTVFLFDRRTHMIISEGQVRVLNQIGEAEQVFDVTNMTFQILPNVFIRHRLLGLWGAGDLIVRTGGPHAEVLEWPNVLFARSRLQQIQSRLKTRDVV